ncbi:hypothetical protein [Nannocystis pusilla]|uniref:Uncharacterized protein n=1 Tax=Nannocystis pusilla TaxID=889268 RepID=A0ABS7U1E9_9BACT|nr:hypothetical protein [Nannocystis pusilla]MBZ5714251.1 hypothetical protein [Nannocystis pusilla]
MSTIDEQSAAASNTETPTRREETDSSTRVPGGEENVFAATGRRGDEARGRDGLGLVPYAELDNVDFRVSERAVSNAVSAGSKEAVDPRAWSPLVSGTWLLAVFTLVSVLSLSIYAFRLSNRVSELERVFASSPRGGASSSVDKAYDMNGQPDVEEAPHAKTERKRRDARSESVAPEAPEVAESAAVVGSEASTGDAEPSAVLPETDDRVAPREPSARAPKEKKGTAKKGTKKPSGGDEESQGTPK